MAVEQDRNRGAAAGGSAQFPAGRRKPAASPVTGNQAASRREDARADGKRVTRLHAVDNGVYADWDTVYRDNIGRMHRLMFAKVGNRADAEDLTTEVFLAALRPLRLPASVGEVRAYLLATARTVLARYWTRTLSQQVTALAEDPEHAPATGRLESSAPGLAGRILAALPERYRRILQLRFLEGCSVAEAATAMDVSVANAKVLQHRAMRRAARIAAELE
jgi:RNA polymerase sigma factor (sigma-70 family)